MLQVLLASIVLSSPTSIHLSKCDSNANVARNCFEEFKGAAKNTFRSESEPDRAKTVGEAVRNCWNCGTETLSNQMREFKNDMSNQDSN